MKISHCWSFMIWSATSEFTWMQQAWPGQYNSNITHTAHFYNIWQTIWWNNSLDLKLPSSYCYYIYRIGYCFTHDSLELHTHPLQEMPSSGSVTVSKTYWILHPLILTRPLQNNGYITSVGTYIPHSGIVEYYKWKWHHSILSASIMHELIFNKLTVQDNTGIS